MKSKKDAVNTDYLSLFNKTQDEFKKNIMLQYEGGINQAMTKAMTSTIEGKLLKEKETQKIIKRVYHVMIESLQNISKHSETTVKGDGFSGYGVCTVTKKSGLYVVTTGNRIASENINYLKKMIDSFNGLQKDEVKDVYKKLLKSSYLSETKGSGLGLIDIIKKTGNKIGYHFLEIDDKNSFFVQKIIINRTTAS